MKYTRFIKSSFWIAILACTSNLFIACEDDITISSENKSFGNIEGNFGYVKSAAGAKALTSITINGDKHGTGHLYFELNKAANKDITVTFKIDESVLKAYNQANGTNYPMYPTDKLSLENEGVTTISAGKQKSSSIELDIQSGGTIGTTYAVAVSATASDGIETSSNNQSYIYLVTPQAALPNTEKGTVKTICYIEVNNENILNTGEYTMENSGKPFFDIVNVFAANIRLNEEGKPYVYCNPQVTFVLENADKLIRPLQQKGIKVHLTILGDHTPAGMRSLGDEAAKDFAKELKSYVDIYGFDGISFDDEWSNYDLVAGYPGLVTPSQEQYSRLIYECRQIMPDKQFGVYWCKQENGGASINYPLGEVEGKDVNDLLDYTVYGNYNLWDKLGHIDEGKQCPYAINLTEGGNPNSIFLNQIKDSWGYFALYNLQISKNSETIINQVGETLYGEKVNWTGQIYGRTDFTSSETTTRINYKYYLGEWKVTTGGSFSWNNVSWNQFGKVMNFIIKIEEKVENESYYIYGIQPYDQILEKYPLVMNYNKETAKISIPIPQIIHEPNEEDPLLWQMSYATLGNSNTANTWKKAETVTNINGAFYNGRLYLEVNATARIQTLIPFCSNDKGNTWLYLHTNFTDQHPKFDFTLARN